MSSGVKGVASRVSITSGVKSMIENISEITANNHSEEEIYATLKECGMDPNETAQKLLLLDTFHEVKRRRDRKKEYVNKEPADLKWKQGNQGRPNRIGRSNYTARNTSQGSLMPCSSPQISSTDAGGGRSSSVVKDNAANYIPEKGTSKLLPATSQDTKKNDSSPVESETAALSNGPSSIVHENPASASGGFQQLNRTASTSKPDGSALLPSPTGSINKNNSMMSKNTKHHEMLQLGNSGESRPSSSASGSYFSSSDCQDLLLSNVVDASQNEFGRKHATSQLLADNTGERKSASAKISTSESVISSLQHDASNDLTGVGKNQQLESSQNDSSTFGVLTVSRPSSNYNNRSQVIGQPKVCPIKEWKPKSSNPSSGLGVATTALSEVIGSHPEPQTTSVVTSKEATLEVQKKLEESSISDRQHLIIPNHLHVSEVKKLGFYFGSFDASFELDINRSDVGGNDGSALLSESSVHDDGPAEELKLSDENALLAAENTDRKYLDQPQSPMQDAEKFSAAEVKGPSSVTPEHNEPKLHAALGSHQFPVVHTPSGHNVGFIPPIMNGQLATLENLESQVRDASRLPGFIVPQSFDPASYYAQFYRAGFVDNDGGISPFHSAATASKYNGNASLVSTQTSQTLQEGGVPQIFSTASPTQLVTQAAGVMQSSISATQQPLPVFRQPTGVHPPHYPPNYVSYGPYFPPFYVPPPAIHQFLSSGAFPQQPQTGTLYPSAPGTSAKYSVSQFKQGSNTGSPAQIGLPGSYGPYGLSMASYTPSSTASAVTSTSNDDSADPLAKENNIYISGQQNEGSGLWFTTLSRDMPGLPASSFYNIHQGQMVFNPAQAGHGTFTGIFHPAQAVTASNVHPILQQSQAIANHVDMAGQAANIYQQPQHAQHNWPSNY